MRNKNMAGFGVHVTPRDMLSNQPRVQAEVETHGLTNTGKHTIQEPTEQYSTLTGWAPSYASPKCSWSS